MGWAEPNNASARKHVVAPWLSGWRVTLDDVKQGDFAQMEAAIAFAYGQAREQAYAGVVGIVVVEASVKELHCFTPSPAARRPEARLRLVSAEGAA